MGRPRKFPEQGLPKRVTLKSGQFYYIHAPDEHGKQRWEGLGSDLEAARAVANAYNDGASVRGTMAWWLDEWVKHIKTQGVLAARTVKDYTGALDYLKPYFGSMAPGAIEAPHVKDYLDVGLAEERAIRANREKAALSSCMTWMTERKHAGLTSNVCLLVARNPETPRTRYITDDEYNKVFDLAGASVRAWMECLYRTLQRPDDILKWTKNNIIEDAQGRKLLAFNQAKTGARMQIVVGPRLQAAFDEMSAARAEQKRKVASLFLICTRDGQPYTQSGLSSMARRHIVDSGVKDFAIYDCKAKGATDMYTAGVPLETISALCGHESVTTTEIYIKRHLVVPVESNEREITRKPKSA